MRQLAEELAHRLNQEQKMELSPSQLNDFIVLLKQVLDKVEQIKRVRNEFI